MTAPSRDQRRSGLALLGGFTSVLGTLAPWVIGGPAGTITGIQTTLGVVVGSVGIANILVALLVRRGQRVLLTVVSLSSAFWLGVETLRAPAIAAGLSPQGWGLGWYSCWAGAALTLLAALMPVRREGPT